MKRFTFLTFLTVAFLFSVLMITSCTKEGAAGKDGIDGAVGPAGPRGEAGVDGIDGTAGCILCHDGGQSQGMFAQVNQWEHSLHATGEAFARNYSPCAPCHTSQGFLQNIAGTYTGAVVKNPNPINCYTCHNIHKTYTPADLGLTKTSKPTIANSGAVVDFGKGNLCAACHQARPINPMPVYNGPNVTLTSFRYGGHYSSQADILAGTSLIKMGGTETYGINTHANFVKDACVTCHMATATGTTTGGHTMIVRPEVDGVRGALATAGCIACHANTTELNAKTTAVQVEVQALLNELREILTVKGIYDNGSKGNAGYAVTGSQPANLAAAFINWQMITQDKSLGVHNPDYVIGILKNTIAKVK